MAISNSLLVAFFQASSKELSSFSPAEALERSEIRQRLLDIQRWCLESVVATHNKDRGGTVSVEDVQIKLRRLDDASSLVKMAMEEMNDAARLAFTRLVLFSECVHQKRRSAEYQLQLKASGSMSRDDILEFIGLCDAVIRLPNVQHFMIKGTPLFDSVKLPPPPVFPQKRLEFIQRLFLQALGYESNHGYSEIKRIFFTLSSSEFSKDTELIQLFQAMALNTDAAITNASMQATQAAFNDFDQGGCTRVVSVKYSETDEAGNRSTDAPSSEAMHGMSDSQQREQLHLARKTAQLHQEILGELLTMRDEERDAKLKLSKTASEDFIKRVAEIPVGPERVAYVQSLDPKTQRLMVMEKLWTSMLEENGGKPPKLYHQRSV